VGNSTIEILERCASTMVIAEPFKFGEFLLKKGKYPLGFWNFVTCR
jgi:hypothetical protein